MTQTLTSPGGGSLAIAGGRNAGLHPPASAPHGEPPGHPPNTPFAAVLDDHQARTAVAEGHHQKRQDAARGRAADDDARGSAIERDRTDADADAASTDPSVDGDRTQSADPTSTEASALAALLGGVPLPAGVKLTAAALATAPQGDAAATSGSPSGIPSETAGLPTDGSVLPMPTGPSVPAAATALPLRPPLPAAADAPGAAPAVISDATLGQPVAAAAAASTAAARATRLADVLQSATARSAGTGSAGAAPAAADVATPPAATVAGARSGDQAQGSAGGPASQPSAPAAIQPAAAAPVQSGTPVAATAPTRGVGLEHAVETVRLALRAAADRGVTHARISLTPRELGSIEVHLRQTADGLVARVVAEHATAAQLLHNAGGELRRQLESQGLTLLRLDIGASGEQGGRAADRQALANGNGAFGDNAGHGRNRGGDAPLAPLDGTAETSTTTTLALPNGALVDVLA
ncbi:MAG TPA: flagellar hook-length control protein FliK [Conexibacter sp.]|nr:flagellar hook-length control protein FliK [Conexibacter sp.]